MSARPSPVDAVLIGAGVRGTFAYGAFAEAHPEHIRFVAVAEPDPDKAIGILKDNLGRRDSEMEDLGRVTDKLIAALTDKLWEIGDVVDVLARWEFDRDQARQVANDPERTLIPSN